jgi:hypothetical protein
MWTENARGLESCYFQIAILLCLSLHFHFADSALHLPSFLDPFRSNSKRRPVASSLDIALQVQSLCFVRFDFYEALTPARQECTFKPVMFDKAIMASLQFPSSFPLTSFSCPSLFAFFTEIQNPLLREAVSPWVFSRLSIEYEGWFPSSASCVNV